MNITILTLGSRGDVQPYVALGLGLQRAGHAVRLVTDSGFAAFVRDYGLDFAPLETGVIQLIQSPEGKAALMGRGLFSMIKRMMPVLRRMMDDAWDASQGSDAIVYHPKVMAGVHIAEKLNVPACLAIALPAYAPTAAFANPVIGGGDYGPTINKLSYDLLTKVGMLPYRKMINAFRREKLGLPPYKDDLLLRGQPVPKLYAYSEHVVPRPSDWGDDVHVTGYWFLSAPPDWRPSRELLAFLSAGAPPVYVGFGSMSTQDAAAKSAIVLEAVRRTGLRAILATGWGGLTAANAPEGVFVLDGAPHDWLFPQCAAVVHHGGSGTTAAGLRAGKPTVIVPFFGDQPFWGRRVAALGVGPAPIPQKKLTADVLADALRVATSDADMAQRAKALSERICAEDGVARAIQAIARSDFG
ncbi:MAG: glycosyl transferase family 1 [Candidatus Roseilinea sp.]|nr:MAG: glycosyl transferase family 1 [Candidatus Roseilinea sp.]